MGKRNKDGNQENSGGKKSLISFCAFWGLALSAVSLVVCAVLKLVNTFAEVNVAKYITGFRTVSTVLLLVSLGLAAFSYVRKKSMGWKIFFAVAFILAALGVYGVL